MVIQDTNQRRKFLEPYGYFFYSEPLTRGYLKEWMFHKLLSAEDVLSPKYDFIEVSLNQKDLGIYAFEEHFDKQLPESQQRREGPIIKLTEDLFWLGMKRQFALQKDGSGLYKMQRMLLKVQTSALSRKVRPRGRKLWLPSLKRPKFSSINSNTT